jgi:hypothetical protein
MGQAKRRGTYERRCLEAQWQLHAKLMDPLIWFVVNEATKEESPYFGNGDKEGAERWRANRIEQELSKP